MRGVVVAAAMMAAVSGARAADMPDLPYLRGSFTDGLTTANANWQGVYFGGQADWGSVTSNVPGGLNSDMQATFIAPNGNIGYQFRPLGQAHSINSGLGAFVGYNSQWDDVIVGIEGNYIHDGFRPVASSTGVQFDPADNLTVLSIASSSAVVRLSDFGSLRLRGGYVIGCFLPYLFFGASLGGQTVDRAVVVTPAPLRPAWTTDSKSRLVYGYTAGVGFDVLLTGGLFARLEYEYRRVTADIESNVNTARIGLGYKF